MGIKLSISMRKPSDLGFSDSGHILPELITNFHPIKNEKNMIINGQTQLFNLAATSLVEVREEQKCTIRQRCELAVDLARQHKTSVYWCNLNAEGDLIQQLDKDAYQIKGSMDIDKKEDLLLNFFSGNIRHLISKPKITSFGLNWQHCNHTVYFPTFSYEQYYQSVRRFWRYGQTRPVTVDLVYSDGQKRVLDSLLAKTKKASDLFSKLNSSVNTGFEIKKSPFDKSVQLPSFITNSK